MPYQTDLISARWRGGRTDERRGPLKFVGEPDRLAADIRTEFRIEDRLDPPGTNPLLGGRLEVDDLLRRRHHGVARSALQRRRVGELVLDHCSLNDQRTFLWVEQMGDHSGVLTHRDRPEIDDLGPLEL